MADKLSKYNAKRDFSNTSEPEGKISHKKGALRFVVQRHHATRLHYDFRLELGGVLKSWAVPKGPSLYPEDRRLAIMVEDHPLSYATFEGDIPSGNYGYGTVAIFDHGTYEPLDKKGGEAGLKLQIESGSLKIVLKGKILKGEFALVKLKNSEGNSWLLIKHKDKYAAAEAFDAEDWVDNGIKNYGRAYRKGQKAKSKTTEKRHKKVAEGETSGRQEKKSKSIYSPMLAMLSETLPDEGEWILQKKLDGFRAIAECAKTRVDIWTRNRNSLLKQFPSIRDALTIFDRHVLLDGEILVEDSRGQSHFQLLQGGEPFPAKYRIRYYIFDLLVLDGNDLREFSFRERTELLRMLMSKYEQERLQLVEVVDKSLDKAMTYAQEHGWEGLIAKEINSPYTSGERLPVWRKLKIRQSQEAIIVGYTRPKGSRYGFGALVLAVKGDHEMDYVGNVGTGFDDKQLKEIYGMLQKIRSVDKPFAENIKVANEREVTWVVPKYIVEISFSEWTKDLNMRHPVFKSLRDDKELDEIKRIMPVRDMINERTLNIGQASVKLTNQKKIYWPEEGILKGDLLYYYEEVAPLILPYLVDKPISMNRFPDGITGKSFFQKDMVEEQLPEWIKTESLVSESTGNTVNYLICNDTATLLWIANQGSIEINSWLSTYQDKLNPAFAVLDIDPNGMSFKEVVTVALTAYEILAYAHVDAYIKTSGSTGLHIYCYVGGDYSFDVTRSFIQMVAELIREQHPETTSLERVSRRKGKIYLDYMQNNKGQTMAAAYSVRPRPGATVSAPLLWEEVNEELCIADYNIQSVLERIGTLKDPWGTIFNRKVDLKKAIGRF